MKMAKLTMLCLMLACATVWAGSYRTREVVKTRYFRVGSCSAPSACGASRASACGASMRGRYRATSCAAPVAACAVQPK